MTMLAHKIFLKKTRRGKIIKVAREHYLRDDLPCGSAACTHCEDNPGVLRKDPVSPCPKLFPQVKRTLIPYHLAAFSYLN